MPEAGAEAEWPHRLQLVELAEAEQVQKMAEQTPEPELLIEAAGVEAVFMTAAH
jgi:predicted dinucleotide-utilizing enzyme